MMEKRRRFQDMQANPDRYEDAQIEAMEREIDSKPDVSSEWRKFASEHGLSHHERLDLTIEEIRHRFGKGAIKNAILLFPSTLPKSRPEITMPTGVFR